MIYNPPATGHVVIILDNATTAMTGHQEHPGTGRTLEHAPTGKVVIEELAKVLGIQRVEVIEPKPGSDEFERVLTDCLARPELAVLVVRRPCVLVAAEIRRYECPEAQKENADHGAH